MRALLFAGLIAGLSAAALVAPRFGAASLAWSTTVTSPIKSTIVDLGLDPHLVFSANNMLHGLDRETGAQIWNWTGKAALTAVTVSGMERLGYVGDEAGNVMAFDILGGKLRWTMAIAGASFTTKPSIAMSRNRKTILVIASDTGAVYTLDGVDGHAIWNVTFGDRPGTPAVTDMHVIVTYKPWNYLVCFDTNDGHLVWNYSTTSIQSVPVMMGDLLVYVGNEAGAFVAIFAPTGAPVWNQTTATVSSLPLVTDDGMVIFGDVGGYVWAFDAWTGKTIWGAQTNSTANGIAATPAVDETLVFVPGTDGILYAMTKANGTLAWTFATGASMEKLTPTVDIWTRRIFVGNNNGNADCIKY